MKKLFGIRKHIFFWTKNNIKSDVYGILQTKIKKNKN